MLRMVARCHPELLFGARRRDVFERWKGGRLGVGRVRGRWNVVEDGLILLSTVRAGRGWLVLLQLLLVAHIGIFAPMFFLCVMRPEFTATPG